jgi:transposase
MKAPSAFTGIFIHRDPVDMRRGIRGLSEIVQFAGMGELSGCNLFVFCGKRRHSIKILYFDKSGFCLWQKLLDESRFPWPKKHADNVVLISSEQLGWLLDGYDVWKMKGFSEIKFKRVS